jgi:citrate lyase subunit beta/citryl-CoA lyase
MRSMLFVPGDSPRKFEKASEGKADALIVDLEDSVVTDKKPEARGLTLTMLKGRRGPHQLYVRVNALDTGMTLADLAAVMPGRPDGIVLPKSQGGDDVRRGRPLRFTRRHRESVWRRVPQPLSPCARSLPDGGGGG